MFRAPTTDDQRIWDLWLTHTYQGAIVAADDLSVFAAIGETPATISDLARRLDFDERATGALVRLLAALGLLVTSEHRFQLTDHARTYLLRSSPFYWGHMMRVGTNEAQLATLVAALQRKDPGDTARADGPPEPAGSGRSIDRWASGTVAVDEARAVAARMQSQSLSAAIAAPRNYDCTGIARMLDVGGGSGCFAIAFAQAHPDIRTTVMELPAMCDVARGYIQRSDVADHVDTVAVDMFRDEWPTGYDAVFFSNVWHDWNVRTCSWLARRAYGVLPQGGRIMLHEMLLDDDGAGPATTASFSMQMLLATQGQQFTFGELRTILEGAGFTGIDATHTCAYYSITTGYKR
jgi:acetylserotonin N-methyltransferase